VGAEVVDSVQSQLSVVVEAEYAVREEVVGGELLLGGSVGRLVEALTGAGEDDGAEDGVDVGASELRAPVSE